MIGARDCTAGSVQVSAVQVSAVQVSAMHVSAVHVPVTHVPAAPVSMAPVSVATQLPLPANVGGAGLFSAGAPAQTLRLGEPRPGV